MENVYLTGFMGSGKTTVGRALARRLGRPFFDVDERVETRAGASVRELFARGTFRALERAAVRSLARRRGAVVALGGGALLDARSRKAVLSTGVLVCLTCAEPVLWRRVKKDLAKRPLLAEGRKGMRKLIKKRRKLQALARWRVSMTEKSPRAAAELIARRLEA